MLKVTFYYKNIFTLYIQPLIPGYQLRMSFDVSHRMPSTFVTCPTALNSPGEAEPSPGNTRHFPKHRT